MRTIRLLIAFDGTDFFGWQLQPDVPTIQGEIEKNLATIHNRHVVLHGAGRTDAGVHATGMVAHFQTEKNISSNDFRKALNSMLPVAIRVLEATEEEPSFHSRFSAKGKTYQYSIFNGEILIPQMRHYTVHIRSALDIFAMEKCMEAVTGTHDFAAFETAGSRDPDYPSEKGSIRTITKAFIIPTHRDFFHFSISGDGFLRHMVRNIVGTALEVGLGRRSIEGFVKALQSKKRSVAGSTAPAQGLTLHKIYY